MKHFSWLIFSIIYLYILFPESNLFGTWMFYSRISTNSIPDDEYFEQEQQKFMMKPNTDTTLIFDNHGGYTKMKMEKMAENGKFKVKSGDQLVTNDFISGYIRNYAIVKLQGNILLLVPHKDNKHLYIYFRARP